MAIWKPERTNFRTWNQIMNELEDPFEEYEDLLESIEVTTDEAASRMWQLYENAITNYTTPTIQHIFTLNLKANIQKYVDLLALFQQDIYPFDDYYRSETYDHTRTPNLTSFSSSTGIGTAQTQHNQQRSTTTTPNNFTTTTTHKVDPFDQSGLRNESQDEAVESGSTTTTESYTGTPDQTTSSTSSSSAVGTTGTDKNEYTKIIHGRDGKRPTSEVIEDGLKAAALQDILDIIISDIADQIFLQIWN